MQGPRKLSPKKIILFRVAVLAIIYVLTELSLLAYLNFSFGPLREDRHRIATGDPTPRTGNRSNMMIHPYIGSVFQPHQGSEQYVPGRIQITEYGFFDDQSPIQKRSPGKVIVGLIGGSVARNLGQTSTAVLERELSRIGEFHGKTFDFVYLALDGQKQPQHLMALNYLLTLGAEFDVLINLDGVNEIALPGMDNVKYGVSAAYPRKWGLLTTNVASLDVMRAIGYLTHLRLARRDCARWYDAAPLRYSPAAALVWKARNVQWERAIRQQMDVVSERSKDEEHTFCRSGPSEHFESEEQLLAHCADIWARSSILLQGVCQARHIHYFHFLQPNQHLPGSKPIGPKEALVALQATSLFAGPVKIGYPLMQARAPQLTEAGVVFTDLTQVFADHEEPLYIDDCCHVSAIGDEIMAVAIGKRIREWYEAQASR